MVIGALVVVGVAALVVVQRSGDDVPFDRILGCTGTPVVDAVPYEEAEAPAEVTLTRSTSVESPTAAVVLDDGTMLVTSRPGQVVAVSPEGDETTVLDLSGETSMGVEQGLLSIATDGERIWLTHTDLDNRLNLLEYRLDGTTVDEGSRRLLLGQDQPTEEHIGGHVVLGPDGMLYLGIGDGGNKPEYARTAQDLDELHGKIVRIDPDGDDGPDGAYGIPADNPFVGTDGARGEVWLSGLRNPWRFSFDDEGGLWIGDVGANCREEVDRIEPGVGGLNMGWPNFEGYIQAFADEDDGETTFPILSYGREDGRCAVVGGHVYRGTAIEGLAGAYVYADLCDAGVIRWLRPAGDGYEGGILVEGGETPASIVSFVETPDGELHIVDLAGGSYLLEPTGSSPRPIDPSTPEPDGDGEAADEAEGATADTAQP